MAKRIALFNHKGGVSKTTTTFNLGWKLAEQGHRVVVVDSDPQCNLTGLVLGFGGGTDLEDFYVDHPERNIYAGLSPAFESRPSSIEAVECFEVAERPGLFLLPGNIRLSEYETVLGIAQELSGSLQTLQNLPGSISFLLEETARRYRADFMIIDMSPGLGPINQNLFSTSDYFLVPTAPDYFSVMAIDSLSRVIPQWNSWAIEANKLPVLRDAAYPFPRPSLKFLGAIVQNFRPRAGAPASSFQKWIDEIGTAINNRLIPAFRDSDLLLEPDAYAHADIPANTMMMAQIPDFNSLIAISQRSQKPIFALEAIDTDQSGIVLQETLRNKAKFDELFEKLANQVVLLTA